MSSGITGAGPGLETGKRPSVVFAGSDREQIRLPASVRRREAITAYLLLSPVIVLFLVFIFGPMLGAIVLSFYDWDLLTTREFAGLDNYRQMFDDSEVRAAITNTLVFAFWSLVTHVGFGLLFALAVQRSMPTVLKYLFRTAVFFPVVMSWASVAVIWNYILDPNFGFINYYLKELGVPTRSWLLSPETAMPAVILVDFWKTIGFTFIIILAGLQGVPQHLYEAAKIDGAGSFRRFIDITLPMLSPTLFLTGIITFIGAFQIFEPMYIMTGGGPLDKTMSIMQKIYESGFREFQMGYASAIAILVFGIILMVTLVQMLVGKYWVFYE